MKKNLFVPIYRKLLETEFWYIHCCWKKDYACL